MQNARAISPEVKIAAIPGPDLDGAELQNADLIIHFLEKIGVDYVFGIPGGAIEPLYNALARSEARGGLRPIVARHETGASFIADGYTRESAKLGVCCGTTGPGATNLITGVASAYENEIPQLVITAQTALSTFGKGASQESSCTSVNTVGMFQHCTRYNTLISHPAQLAQKLQAAIRAAFRAPSGPAHLSIPIDILNAPARAKDFSLDFQRLVFKKPGPDTEQLDLLLEHIGNARKVVLVVGIGCVGASHVIVELADLLDAQIVTSIDGKGLINSCHPLYRGVFGFAGHSSAADALREPDVDLVIALGSNLSELASGGWDEQSLLSDRLIHVDPVEYHFANSPMAKMQIYGSISDVGLYLIEHLHKPADDEIPEISCKMGLQELKGMMPSCELLEPEKYSGHSTPIKPQRLMKELGSMFPPNTRFLADIGNSFAWATHYLHPVDRRLRNRRAISRPDALIAGRRVAKHGTVETSAYRSGIEFASMGWAIGAVIGTAIANRDCPVVCITGDGSMLMSGQEITVAKAENLTVIFVILNDSALGMVKHGQRLANAERTSFKLPTVDFAQFARAMGIEAHTINSPSDMQALDVQAIISKSGPTLLDVYIDPEEAPPMGLRVKLLEASQRLKKRRDKYEGRTKEENVDLSCHE